MRDLIIKPRAESDELKTFRSLNIRGKLTEKEKNYYLNLEKGFEGEVRFDNKHLSRLSNDFLILNDLIFDYNNNEFQIDSFLISQNSGHLFEIKNFRGDYYFKDGKFHSKNGKERKDPLLQLERAQSLLRQLLYELGIGYSFTGNLVFVNPEFYLYHASMDQPILFPNQLNRFMNKLNTIQSKLDSTHHKLAEKLIAASKPKSSYTRVPKYSFEELKKGIPCVVCWSFDIRIVGQIVCCNKCGFHEALPTAVLRCVEEHQLLFPDRIITTRDIYEWCGIILSKKTVKTILLNNLNQMGHGNRTFYTY